MNATDVKKGEMLWVYNNLNLYSSFCSATTMGQHCHKPQLFLMVSTERPRHVQQMKCSVNGLGLGSAPVAQGARSEVVGIQIVLC